MFDGSAGFLFECAFENNEAGVLVGNAAQLRMHKCRWLGNDCALAVRAASCRQECEQTQFVSSVCVCDCTVSVRAPSCGDGAE